MISSELPGRTIKTQKGELLYFSGTSYLGLAQLPEFKELIKEGIDKVGTHFGGSRLSNIQIDIFELAEEKLAAWCGSESALLLTSGSQAGFMVANVKKQASNISAAPGTHSALWSHFLLGIDSEKNCWQKKLDPPSGKSLILSNTVDSLFCQPSHLDQIQIQSQGTESLVIADDSHGIGVLGEDGSGLYKEWKTKLSGDLIFMGSLGKGMGLPAGYILGSENVIKEVKSGRTFGGSSPPNPAFLYAWLKSGDLYQRQLQRLRKNMKKFISSISNPEVFNYIDGYPAFHIPQEGWDEFLLQKGIVISSFHYPGPNDPKVTRIVLNALHTDEDIEMLVDGVNEMI